MHNQSHPLLTQRRQIQALGDLLHGLEPQFSVHQFTSPYDQIYQFIIDTPSGDAYTGLMHLKLAEPELAGLIEDIF